MNLYELKVRSYLDMIKQARTVNEFTAIQILEQDFLIDMENLEGMLEALETIKENLENTDNDTF